MTDPIIGRIDHIVDGRMGMTGWLGGIVEPSTISLGVALGSEALGGEFTFEPIDEGKLRFHLTLTRAVTPLEVVSGSFRVTVEIPNSNRVDIGPSTGLTSREPGKMQKQILDLPAGRRAQLEKMLGSPRPVIRSVGSGWSNSFVAFPVGLSSADGSRVLGHDGFVFAMTGSNRIAERFFSRGKDTEERTDREVAEWEDAIKARAEWCDSNGIRFRQLVVPDKHSVLPQQSPLDIDGPTLAYANLMKRFAKNSHVLDLLPSLRQIAESSNSPWLRTDTHPSSAGVQAMVSELMTSLGYDTSIVESSAPVDTTRIKGDLGVGFFSVPLYEEVVNFSPLSQCAADEIASEVLRSQFSHKRGADWRRGHYEVFRNGLAPFDEKLMLVGTSTSNFGKLSNQITWWLKQLFTEVHFVWQTEIEFELVEAAQPSILIGQTVERYLARTPADTYR